MAAAECQLETVLAANSCHIQRCIDCGTITLAMGAISLKVPPSFLVDLSRDLSAGVVALKLEQMSQHDINVQNVTPLR